MNAQPTWNAGMEALFMITVQVAVMVPLILLTQWLLRLHLSARWRHAFWWLVVLRLVLPVSIETPVSVFNLAQFDNKPRPGTASSFAGEELIAPVPQMSRQEFRGAPPEERWNSHAEEHEARPDLSDAKPAVQAPRLVVSNSPVGTAVSPYPAAISLVWLVGMFVFLLIVGLRTLMFHRRFRGSRQRQPDAAVSLLAEVCRVMGLRRRVELVETDAVTSPVLHGLLKLRVLLPYRFEQRFTEEELRFVLFHELAHVKRHDLGVNWMLVLLQAIHWFNPMVWLAFARMRSDRELACDELVLRHTDPESAPAYGRTIIKLLEKLSRPSPMAGIVGILEDRKQMKRRIQMIATYTNKGRWSVAAATVIACLGLVTLTDGQPVAGTVELEVPGDSVASESSDGGLYSMRPLEVAHRRVVKTFVEGKGFGITRVPRPGLWNEAPINHAGETYTSYEIRLIGTTPEFGPRLFTESRPPQKERIAHSPSRELSKNEMQAIERLKARESVLEELPPEDESVPNIRRVVAPIFATDDCLKCHSVEPGDMLGAFEYVLMPRVPEHAIEQSSPAIPAIAVETEFHPGDGYVAGRPTNTSRTALVRANEVITVADDFVVEIYHNGVRVPDEKRELIEELHGATAERIPIKVKQNDWLVFHVVNNRLRWGGAYYFGVAGVLGSDAFGFVSESTSGDWSFCDSPELVEQFVSEKEFMTDNRVVVVENPWGNGAPVMKRFAGESWPGEPIWGKERSTWIKVVVR